MTEFEITHFSFAQDKPVPKICVYRGWKPPITLLLRSLLRCLNLLGDVRQRLGRSDAEHPPSWREGQRSSGDYTEDFPRLFLQDSLPPLRPLHRQELAHGLRLCSPQPRWQWGRGKCQRRKYHLAGTSCNKDCNVIRNCQFTFYYELFLLLDGHDMSLALFIFSPRTRPLSTTR